MGGLSWLVPVASLVASIGAVIGGYLYSRRGSQSISLTDLDVHLRVLRERLDDAEVKLTEANRRNEMLQAENIELLRKLVKVSNGNGEK